jgi:hypothetical protein
MATSGLQHQGLAAALGRNETLVSLLRRVQDSRARLAALQPVLPPALWSAVEAGPLDETQWMLLARHGSVAAKLRQCVPQMETALAAAGFERRVIRIKVRTAG